MHVNGAKTRQCQDIGNICQLGTPRYIGKENATPSSDPKLSGKSCHTTTQTNQYNEHIQTITLAPGQVPHRFQGGNTYVQGSTNG